MSAPSITPAAPWHILGAGAIGGLWAMRLAAAGIGVTLLNHNDTRPTRTITLQDGAQHSSHSFPQLSADNYLERCHAGEISRLLVCTKACNSTAALTALLPLLGDDACVVFLQNGMGTEDALRALRPHLCLLNAITSDGVFRPDKDRLIHAGHGETWLGCSDPAHEKIAKAIATTLSSTGWPVQFSAGILQRRWQKLAINCAINPLTARYHCRNGELLKNPDAVAAIHSICTEVALVMRAEGLSADAEKLFELARQTAEKTAANISSMRADVDAGRCTEIDFMNGYLLRRANAHGIAVPVNKALCAEIQALSTKKH
jgi:2-dehydropantoate 2-reductase